MNGTASDDVDWVLAKARVRSTVTDEEAETLRSLFVGGDVSLKALRELLDANIRAVDAFEALLIEKIETRRPFYRVKLLRLLGVTIVDEPTRSQRREVYAQMRPQTLRFIQAMAEARSIIGAAFGVEVSLDIEGFFEIAIFRAGRVSTVDDVLDHLRVAAATRMRLKRITDYADELNAAQDFCAGNRGFHTQARRHASWHLAAFGDRNETKN